jgi:hypothetical protein
MKNRILFIVLTLQLLLSGIAVNAQYSLGLGPATYFFIGSNDNNLHYGLNARLAYDTHQIMFDAGFSFYDKVTSSVRTLGYRDPQNPFDTVEIYNSVNGASWSMYLNLHYYFIGMPESKGGFYGLAGVTALYYTQTNSLSTYDTHYFPTAKFIDKAVHSSTQLAINAGIGTKYSLRHSSLFIEGLVSIPTDRYLDYQYPIENAVFISVNAGVRFTLSSRRNEYQRWDIELNPF